MTKKKIGKRIQNINQLYHSAIEGKMIVCTGSVRRIVPVMAMHALNFSGIELHELFITGMYVYIPLKK